MKRIKDFFYNWNDLVIVLLILAAAAAVIYWRATMIMDYPKTLAKDIQEGTAELDIEMPAEGEEAADAEAAEGEEAAEGADGDAEGAESEEAEAKSEGADAEATEAGGEKAENGAAENAENKDENKDASKTENKTENKDDKKDDKKDENAASPAVPAPEDNNIWKDGKLIEDMIVTTGEGSAMEAAQALVDAGLFTSYENFEEICNAYGFVATDIKASDFVFKKGFTQQQIAEEVTKPME